MRLIKPRAISPGALVGIVAPASPVRAELLELGIAELERLGFRVRLAPGIHQKARYTAGSEESRSRDLVELWDDPDVDALFCARGGYGTMQLLSKLSPERFRESPKAFVGSSDATAMLSFLLARAGVVAFHGPMVAQQIARGSYDSQNLVRLLQSSKAEGLIEAPDAVLLHRGAAEGTLWGGCLSLVASLVGTPYLPAFDGAILFLEDTGTKPYQLDRMLTQLRLAGALSNVRGIVFGEMPNCEQHPEQGYVLQDVLRDWTAELAIPVLFGFPSGHSERDVFTLAFGVRARLDDSGLSLLEGAVS